jgi:RNA polymerase sigma factor (sigma-70 family)
MSQTFRVVRRSTRILLAVAFDRKTFLSDPTLLAALGAHVRSRVPKSDADDVMQSVIADALAAENAPDDADTLKRWLFGVARNKIADFYRRNKREQPSENAGDDLAAPTSNRSEAKELLQWAEAELPPDSDAKRTFEWMLREGEGEKLESIAASEKLPAPRVRKRVSRMREHFRARWAAYAAALAAAGIALIIAFYIFRKKPGHDGPQAKIVREPSATQTIAAPSPTPSPSPSPTPTPSPTPSPSPIPTLTPTAIPSSSVPRVVPTATTPSTPMRSTTSGSSL